MKIHKIKEIIGLLMLLFAVGFNLWLYRQEPTATVDPNDNTFQFALVNRTNEMLDFADKNCSGVAKPFCVLSLLSDHWVPNWAEGYNLPYYYSHAPQIAIVLSYRLLSPFLHTSLFTYYHWITYLLLSCFPVAMYASLLVIGLSPVAAGFGAVVSTQISTDGLYGLDPSSFLWRGYGLSSQLYAMVFLPLAIAFTYRLFVQQTEPWERVAKISRDASALRFQEIFRYARPFILPILFLAATTAGHLGIGIIGFLSVGIITISPTIQSILQGNWSKETWMNLITDAVKMLIIFAGVGLILGYWILPILANGNYHNTSVWDPIWKFDSYGYDIVLKNLFNGDLFDFHRFPTLTVLALIGLLYAASQKNFRGTTSELRVRENFTDEQSQSFFPLSVLFAFWVAMYFGTTTWGHILYVIPGMSDFHLSRFIVGVHIAGLFLIPLGAVWITKSLQTLIKAFRVHIPSDMLLLGLTVLVAFAISSQTIAYAQYNDLLIARANTNYAAVQTDAQLLVTTLQQYEKASPGRVFSGRGGQWGKSFRVAETPYYLYLSTYGLPTILWLPETWSPNSDTEQYFRENVPEDYDLYNVRYVVTPSDLTSDQIQPFWKPLAASKTWKLYSVPSEVEGSLPTPRGLGTSTPGVESQGYITAGVRPAIVSTGKLDYLNVVRLWIQSDFHKNGLYPQLTFDKNYPKNTGLPNFRMIDEVTYKVPDGSVHDLFAGNPMYIAPAGCADGSGITITNQGDDTDMVYSAAVTKSGSCPESIVILKSSAHPSWTATIDGKQTPVFTVFPFYSAIHIPTGAHTVVFRYRPSVFKQLLLFIGIVSFILFFGLLVPKKKGAHER